MKTKITSIALLVGSFFFAQINTQTKNDANQSTAQSGFYQTNSPQNYPTGATSWWGLIDLHNNESTSTNNYGIQIAGSFFNQELWLRKNNNNNSQQWSKFVLENTDGNVGIGKSNPQAKLDVFGGIIVGNDTNYFSYDAGADIKLKYAPRGSGGRAIVHDFENFLTINFAGDFTGGTRIGSNVIIRNNGDSAFQGKLEAKEIKVTLTPTADFVFEENYGLPKLKDVEKFIKENKHLPEIASAKTMEKEGVNVGEFQIKLLQKIEELTLYVIDQQKKIETLENKLSGQIK